uniref:Cullin family profile domain-containing protein n=1 Tax=Haptolina brevifila TaxID=156173 RepID=A0A7S2MM82_9EUKA
MAQSRSKFVIQPFKHNNQMDEDYANRTWQTLHDAIHLIHRQNAGGLSFEELYRNAYNMVLHKFGDKLYAGLTETITTHLQAVAAQVQAANDEAFLPELKDKWDKHKLSSIMIRDILMYMDRTYVTAQKKTPVYERGLQIFRDEVCRNPRIKDRLLHMLLDLIQRERQGEMIERGLLKTITSMLVELGRDVYVRDFEGPFLQASSTFYQAESQEYISQNSAADYMKKAEQRLQEEVDRVAHYLDPSSEAKTRQVAEQELIARHMKTIAEMEHSGIIAMIEDSKLADLARAYELFKRVTTPTPGLNVIRDIMAGHVRARGTQVVQDEELGRDPVQYVQRLLELRDKYEMVISQAFSGDKLFYNALNQSFEYFINLNKHSPEYISLFVDEQLRKGMKGTSEEDVEATLEKVVMLFRYLQEKDFFEKYYKQHLAKRLLGGRSVSEDAERSMIIKLKHECGHQYTSKLEGMFHDIKLSAEGQEAFRARNSNSSKIGGIELSVHVLTTGFWPNSGQGQAGANSCVLPPQITKCCEVFKEHYLKQHSGRRLTWQTNMGHADIKAVFGGAGAAIRKYEINVSTQMMCILLQFNEADTRTYADLVQATEIPGPDLKRSLQSLACAKFKILNKEPKGRDVFEGDSFSFNADFTAKQLRFKVGTVTATKETEGEKLETRQKVDEDRKPQIDAALVRVMKSRKEMDHNALIAEVTSQLSARFLPSPNVIKKRIESLIEREFLERDKDNWRKYKYVA